MILKDVNNYIIERKFVSEDDIINHFDIENDFLKTLLEQLVALNKIILINPECNGCSSSCKSCTINLQKFYSVK